MKRLTQLAAVLILLALPSLAHATISPQQGCSTGVVVSTTTNCSFAGASGKGNSFVFFGVCAEAVAGTPCPITPSDNQSNSYSATPDGQLCVTATTLCSEVFYAHTLTATIPTVTITTNAAGLAVLMGAEEYTNFLAVSPVDQSGHTNGSSTTASFGNQTTVYQRELVALFVANPTAGLTGAMGTCSQRQLSSSKELLIGDVYETAKGTFDCTATISPTGAWSAHQITFIEQVARPPAIF